MVFICVEKIHGDSDEIDLAVASLFISFADKASQLHLFESFTAAFQVINYNHKHYAHI